jgi:hypothetical protein
VRAGECANPTSYADRASVKAGLELSLKVGPYMGGRSRVAPAPCGL